MLVTTRIRLLPQPGSEASAVQALPCSLECLGAYIPVTLGSALPLKVLPGLVGAIPSWDLLTTGGYARPLLGCRVALRQHVLCAQFME